ncbi:MULTISPECIES: hypothetical protein [Rhizobium]|uniref:Secreted protein n=1 Tax=Rhizobium favelukesii TaxID=348824 RepID=W6RR03_9HYPH|nr:MULTISPECIES: hypothetical protein [Rhizobium]MCS0459824.1 hypothetical protein [Rhizobium favelukesii]UFS85279.1 hypothetical protein LPB79_37100 [Rhizobium sp. T136]CDM61288.1 hypothetical protein LPU83_pLPU83c_0726 [Rhizobium favelukesii]
MMKLRLIRIFMLALPAMLVSVAARADTLQLSKVDRKIESHIQRGNTRQNVQCLAYILKDFQERKIRKSKIYVTFDDPNIDGIGVGLVETDENYTCEAGELRAWEANEYQLVKTF